MGLKKKDKGTHRSCGEHKKQFAQMRYSQLYMAIVLIIVGSPVLAQNTAITLIARPAHVSNNQSEDKSVTVSSDGQNLESVTVTGNHKRKIGKRAGASKEDVERRGASHMSDLIDQISGTSVNSLYTRPEVSVGVQGVAGHGRIAQSLEGITQNFHAFTQDIGQTGSIFIDPLLLRSIDVTRGVTTSTGTQGSLGGAVDFKYMDIEDILQKDKNLGGMARGSIGLGKYGNGQKPSGAVFLGGRNERWEAMIGASHSKNDAYHVGSHLSNGGMVKYFHVTNLLYNNKMSMDSYEHCRYGQVRGIASGSRDGLYNCQPTAEQVQQLKQAAKSAALTGTEKKADSQMLRVRHYFNDSFDQSLALFAANSRASYQTDQQPNIRVPANGSAYWGKRPWSIGAEMNNRVVSLQYKAAFSDAINPEIQLYREQQKRKQRWLAIPGTAAVGEDMHYFVDSKSTGLRLSNASHFSTPYLGPLRLDAALELRRTHKEVDSFSETDWLEMDRKRRGRPYTQAQEWDPNSRNNTQGIALNLSTEGDGPWQANAGIAWQRVAMDIISPRFMSGNIAREGVLTSADTLRDKYRRQGYSYFDMMRMASEELRELANKNIKIDPNYGNVRFVLDDQKHYFNLKSASLGWQYTRSGTGLTAYGALGYSERAPTSNEMYTSGPWLRVSFVANPHLDPEKNLSLQLGVSSRRHAWLTPADELNVDLGYYRNRVRNYIGYGPIWMKNDAVDHGRGGTGGAVANVNNLAAVIRHGFELNLAYRQPLFYIRSNLTIPLRHNNKMCSWQSPSGDSYNLTYDAAWNAIYTQTGKGQVQCYSGWNWMETSLIEPLRGSLTAALTPYDGKIELGSTLHFRGKQRASYYYLESAQNRGKNHASNHSSGPVPDGDGWIKAHLLPKTYKVDLFFNYRYNDRFKVGLYLANLTDKFDGTPTSMGYNFYPGRTITGNLEYRF